MNKVTESDSHYDSLEKMSTEDLLYNINSEDNKVASIVNREISKICKEFYRSAFSNISCGKNTSYESTILLLCWS